MTLAIKPVGDGTLGATKATLYTVPSGTTASVRISVTNTASAAVKVYLYANTSGTSRLIEADGLELDPKDTYHGDYEELAEGDKIEGYASTAALVVYRIKGIERS
jgi:hypothetical protein